MDGNPKMIPASGSGFVFLNSKSIFVEYIDIIRAPYFFMMYSLSKHPLPDNSALDLSSIRDISEEKLAELYYGRRHQNPLYGFAKFGADFDKLDIVMDRSIEAFTIENSPLLKFADTIKILMHTDSLLTKKVFIYYPYDNPAIRADVKSTFAFSKDIEFVCGDLNEALKKVPEDSTYVFSDVMKVDNLFNLGKLNMASLIFPYEYGYNYEDPSDPNGKLLVDLDKYRESTIFKVDFFLASIDRDALKMPEKQ